MKKNVEIFLFLLSCIVAIVIAYVHLVQHFVLNLGTFGYLGVFIAGMMYVYTLTAALGIVMLLLFAHSLPVFGIALIAGVGSVVADYLIFTTSRHVFSKRYAALAKTLAKWFHKKDLKWVTILIAVLLFLLPLPDEISVTIMGVSKVTKLQFVVFAFLLNSLGILLLLQVVHL